MKGNDEDIKEEQEMAEVAAGFVKMRTKGKLLPEMSLRHMSCVQDLGSEHKGAVWTMKFSVGQLSSPLPLPLPLSSTAVKHVVHGC
jgi:hypothetical protein